MRHPHSWLHLSPRLCCCRSQGGGLHANRVLCILHSPLADSFLLALLSFRDTLSFHLPGSYLTHFPLRNFLLQLCLQDSNLTHLN